MATQKQIEAARRNGARSLGPITPEGKERSSRNALKHGLAADPYIILGTENNDNYDKLLEAYIATYLPASGDEYDLVCQIVSASWRLRRIGRLEANLLEDQMTSTAELLESLDKPATEATLEAKAFRNLTYPGRSIDLVVRYTAMARRCFDTALKTLRDLQRERRKLEKQNEPDLAQVPSKSTPSKLRPDAGRPRLNTFAVIQAPLQRSIHRRVENLPENESAKDPDVKIKQ